ncbi:LytR/AlgR family response regulator transcription factor [Pedobacter duraquae]|uniref:LytTR family two component transcriptional regulator n=1 Tax=Pedobacter duraquae TaxID=425511 RepID=A0A4R6IFI0_9SPHI|nr:LytTR family DNA-binding domain-containing protein [Pedobacter duraquae]TDO20842.1 LytTR family two component transcriptional regulator [Pedobacter duraquae]
MAQKCVIIDDDQYAIDALVKYIGNLPELYVYMTFKSSVAALSGISKSDEIDFIFLDIEMPEISGLELAGHLRDKTRFLIFTTSHASHALKAFDLHVNQYLLKPITFAKFAFTTDFLLKNTPELPGQPASLQEKKQFQFIKGENKSSYYTIDPADIIYIEAAKNYVNIYTSMDKYVTHMGVNHVENALGKDDFIRISKFHIIAKNAIKKIEGNVVRLKDNDMHLQVGDAYKAEFSAFIKSGMLSA